MIKEKKGFLYLDREISWLRFNERVLQEAENPLNPLMERLKFLAIFSSNLDEFFRVRVAQLRRLQRINAKKAISDYQFSPDEILNEIQRIVVNLQERFTEVYKIQLLPELANRNIFLIDEHQLNQESKEKANIYFKHQVLSHLFPIIIDKLNQAPHLRDRSIYLAVRMSNSASGQLPKHALIEVPSNVISRFYEITDNSNKTYILMLEDLMRLNLHNIFSIFDYTSFEGYIVKITRDAEFTIDKDDAGYSVSLLTKIQKSIKQRSKGSPTRFVYDEAMPKEMLELLIQRLELKNVNLIPGGRYHNFKDFLDFPKIGNQDDYFTPFPQIPILAFEKSRTIFKAIDQKDVLVHHPFQTFDYLIRMLREAAIDPNVLSIRITLYRVARHSNVVNALINAVKNGKKVIVLMELQARFDEESNIYWTTQLQEAGAQVYFGKAGQKVHCKYCLIETLVDKTKKKYYAHLSTGNYNGVTSRLYSDIALFTCNKEITDDLLLVSDLLFNNIRKTGYKQLLVAPEFMKKQFIQLIEKEAQNKLKGKPAYIIAKMNSLVDIDVINALYKASQAGVSIKLAVRGICSLVPGVAGISDNIKVISILDRYLEHMRCYIFCNNNNELVYLASADWMSRNLISRIEIAFPILDPDIKAQMKQYIQLHFNDNTKARIIDGKNDTEYVKPEGKLKVRAQYDTYNLIKQQYLKLLAKD